MRFCKWLLAATVMIGCTSKPPAPTPAPPLPQTLEAAVEGMTFRTATNKARDQYRHPLQTLQFFGLQPNMSVVEIWPSTGWYTEILAPYLAAHGTYIGAVNPGRNNENVAGNAKLAAWFKSHPEVAIKTKLVDYDPAKMAPTEDFVEPNSVDLILTFRNLHNWVKAKAQDSAFAAYFRALKPGGVLGVVDHRAGPKSKPDSGYLQESAVIAMAKKAGFQLMAKSEINANPLDKKNYRKGVWTLPPSNRHDAADDAKYAAIGESDRMTLKFVKPIKKIKTSDSGTN